MINKLQINALAIFITSISFGFYYVTDLNELGDWTKLISFLTLFIGLAITVFVKWLWKIPLLYPWFCEVPNLNGTWETDIQSNISSNDIVVKNGIEIRQNYKNVSVFLETKESRSETITANFVKTTEGYKLLYTYQNEPNMKLRKRSPMHFGAAQLYWNDKEKNILKGHYWTDRGSTGSLHLMRQPIE